MTRPRDADGNPVSYPSDNKPRTRKPGGAGNGATQVTAIIPLELKARLDRCALVMGFSVGAVVREAVLEYLDRLEPAPPMQPITCWCESCDVASNKWRSRMALCPECGDKRCERARRHDNPCSTTRDDARANAITGVGEDA